MLMVALFSVAVTANHSAQAYAHVLVAERCAVQGDLDGAARELRYALVFDYDSQFLRERLKSVLGRTHASVPDREKAGAKGHEISARPARLARTSLARKHLPTLDARLTADTPSMADGARGARNQKVAERDPADSPPPPAANAAP